MKRWYAVQTKPRQEAIAETNLLRQGFDPYLPKISLRKRRHKQWAIAIEPLFPRYLFIWVDPNQRSLAPVRSTVGVAALVRFGHQLRPVPDSVIDFLKASEDPDTRRRQAEAWPHQPGDALEIMAGPFTGLSGVFQMPLAEERALLLVALLGRQNRVAVDMQALSAAS